MNVFLGRFDYWIYNIGSAGPENEYIFCFDKEYYRISERD